MEYLLKSSCLLIIFYLAYRLFLNRDTLFNSHRWFLLFGLIGSLVLPLIIIPNYVQYEPIELAIATNMSDVNELSPRIEEMQFDWFGLLQGIYVCGVGIMLIRFLAGIISIIKLLNSNRIKKIDGLFHLVTEANISPFSFFNLVVYNPSQYMESDLKIILAHEEVHIKDWHTLDVILCELITIIFWFNPFCHLYKKHLKQNLEFIADNKANNKISQDLTYETVLLKTSLSDYGLILGNRFYNSLIKKRIVMLQKPRSNKLNLLKYLIILPLVGAFMMGFNTKTIYIEKPTASKEQLNDSSQDLNVLKYVITQKTSDEQINMIKEQFKAKDVDIKFNDIKRDKNGYLTSIHIVFKSDKSKGDYHITNESPISDILIKYDVESGSLSIGENSDKMSQTIHLGEKRVKIQKDTIEDVKIRVIEKIDDDSQEEGKSKTKTMSYSISNGDNIFVIADDDDHYVVVDTIIKEDIKKMTWVSKDGTKTSVNANHNDNDTFFYRKSGDAPIIIKDGKRVTKDELKFMDVSKIGNVAVWKGDRATKKYGVAGKNGVIVIDSKPHMKSEGYAYSIKNNSDHEYDFDFSEDKGTMMAIGYNKDYKYAFAHLDKTSTKEELEKNKEALKQLGVNVKYSKIRRNRDNEITRIKILLEDENGKEMNVSYNNSDGIPEIRYGKNHDGLFANSSK